MKNKNKQNNNTTEAQQVLIANLKKQLSSKRSQYQDMIYRAAILDVANSKVKDENPLRL